MILKKPTALISTTFAIASKSVSSRGTLSCGLINPAQLYISSISVIQFFNTFNLLATSSVEEISHSKKCKLSEYSESSNSSIFKFFLISNAQTLSFLSNVCFAISIPKPPAAPVITTFIHLPFPNIIGF